MKTLRGSFYGVTKAFVWLKNICILHGPIMVLSDRCQTHQSCAFLCALSNGVYCTMRSSGSLCLHICPWWEYNISAWFVFLWQKNTPLTQKTTCHNPYCFTLPGWFQMRNFLVWNYRNKMKHKMTSPFFGTQHECPAPTTTTSSSRSPTGEKKNGVSGWSAARTVKSLIVTCTVCFNKRG